MRRRGAALRWMIAVAGMVLVTPALGVSPSCAWSVESAAAESDVIVLGRVRAIVPSDPPGVPGTTLQWQRVTVDVAETLKGPPTKQLDFYLPPGEAERAVIALLS